MSGRPAPRAAVFAVAASLALAAAGAAFPALARAAGPAARRPVPAAKPRPRPASADSLERSRPGPHGTRVAPRMLDDIHIEGEIPVPQVLFITARDQRRFMEFQHHRYARTSLELGRGTAMPSGIVIPEPSPAERKEIQR